MSDEHVVTACPECGSSNIDRREQRDCPHSRGVGWYRCHDCETAFDEAVERAPIQGGSSTVATLRRVDPDELLGGDDR